MDVLEYLQGHVRPLVNTEVVKLAEHYAAGRIEGRGHFSVPREVFCYVDHLGELALGGPSTARAVRFIREFFPSRYHTWAVVLARARHDVYATMRNPDSSPELRTIAHQESLPLTILRLDVESDAAVTQAVRQVLAERGHIDALVNNAGISPFGAVEDLPLDVFRRTMETNYFGALRCMQAVLPAMRERKSGCIINVTSIAGRIALGAHGSYTATMFALEALSEVLAQEVKPYNIRVVIVEPGIIQTPLFDKLPEDPPALRYPHEGRLRALCAASLRSPVSPFVVGEAIRQIIESDSWQLRYPVGPDAGPFLEWRAAMTDEKWITWNTPPNEEAWYAQLERDFGLDARPFRGVRSITRGV